MLRLLPYPLDDPLQQLQSVGSLGEFADFMVQCSRRGIPIVRIILLQEHLLGQLAADFWVCLEGQHRICFVHETLVLFCQGDEARCRPVDLADVKLGSPLERSRTLAWDTRVKSQLG